jgi:hypothetical protein
MISHKHKFIYTRVAKTASSTIMQLIRKYVDDLTSVVDDDWMHDVHHVPLWYLKKNIPEKEFNLYFKFGFVRNPWDRLVSAYHYSVKWYAINDAQNAQKLNLKIFDNFSTWLRQMHTEINKYGSQWSYVRGCDFIGKTENLQQDFNTVCDKIGIPQQKLSHKNKSKHKKHYTEYYDDETRSIVAEKYAKDIEYFGYKFGE